MVNESTGRANQVLCCLQCSLQTTKICNIINHVKTHEEEELIEDDEVELEEGGEPAIDAGYSEKGPQQMQ